jgi:hypothetical protein
VEAAAEMTVRLLAALALSGCSVAATGEVMTIAGTPTCAPDNELVDGNGAEARFAPPGDLVVDSAGTIYLADVFNNAIRRVTADGTVTTIVGGTQGLADGVGSDARFHLPTGLALASDNDLYVADTFNSVIRHVDLVTFEVTTVIGRPNGTGLMDGPFADATLTAPSDIDMDESGRLWIVDRDDNAVRIADFASEQLTTIAGGSGGISDGVGAEATFNSPAGIAADDEGAWVADRANSTLRRVAADGTVSTVAGAPLRSGYRDGQGALLDWPTGITMTNDGAVLFADRGNNVLRLLTEDGVRWVAGRQYVSDDGERPYAASEDGPAEEAILTDPRGVAMGSDGTIYFTDLCAVRAVRGWEPP